MDFPCPRGEGDCDEDSQCAGTLVCGTDNCESGPRDLDCCTSTCNNDSECVNQECDNDINLCRLDSYSTDWSKCHRDFPCDAGEGDCDDDRECKGFLVCINKCGPSNMDCCVGKFMSKSFRMQGGSAHHYRFFRLVYWIQK